MSTDVNDSIERPREDRKAPARPSGWHAVNVGHLVMGTAFVGLVIVWALLTSDTVQLEDARWILPLPWLVGGALGLAATVLRGPRQHPYSARMQGWLHDSSDNSSGDKTGRA